ncbi:MAG: dTDP-glucose 4,6-dehydratase [Desulfobacterales bacterium]
MKNILVTGGCGFIGSNFIRYLLLDEGFDGRLINLDKMTYAGNAHNLSDIQNTFERRYAFVKGDICDTDLLKDMFHRFEIDTVCHFAAESHVDRSILGPADFIQTNVIGTFQLLEACRLHMNRIERFHHVSTDEVFGSLGESGFFSEDTPYDPSSPYSASKAGSDHLVTAYGRTYGLPVTISNCSNNYGPFQFPEKLIPLTILNALAGNPIPVYGDGVNVRDWLYVKDHCKAVLKVMQHGRPGLTYLIGGKNERKNIDVVNTICDMLDEVAAPLDIGPRRQLIRYVSDRPGHDFRYAIDPGGIQSELGWQPEETFQSGIRKTIQWYLEHPEWVSRVVSGEYRDWIEAHYPFNFRDS